MRLPTSRAEETIRQVVRLNSTSYTITRPGEEKGRFGESTPSTSTHTADAWLFSPSETNIDTEFGDRLTGSLAGMALPTENIVVGDRVTFQSTEYKVVEVIHLPEENPNVELVIKQFTLEKRVNT